MTQDATTTQTSLRQPGISRLAYHYVGSLVAQVVTLPASVSINPAQTDNDDPARYSIVNFPTLLIRANYACARTLDRWQGYAYAHLKSMGWMLAFTMIQYRDGENVENFIDKLSSYNIFNYLFPGVIFCVVADRYFFIPLLQDSIITGFFLYYFVGLVISRFGSLALEPIMKKLKIVKFSEYSDFLNAVKSDPKIEILSETNNMYRSIFSALLLLCLVVIGKSIFVNFESLEPYLKYAILPVLVVLLGFSYKKQTGYIVKRIEANKDKPVDKVKN